MPARSRRSKYSPSTGESRGSRFHSRSRPRARTSRSRALSLWGTEPCPARPSATSRSQSGPFSAVVTVNTGRFTPNSSVEPPPPSLMTNSATRASGWCSSSHSMPSIPPASSSATARNTMSRASDAPDRFSSSTVSSSATPSPFMSSVPRPQISPLRMTAANGSSSQYSRSTGTTSVWLSSIRGCLLPLPLSTARSETRSSPGSNSSYSNPSRSRMPPRKSHASRSRPGGFDVSMRRYSCRMPSASSKAASQSTRGSTAVTPPPRTPPPSCRAGSCAARPRAGRPVPAR